jgi:hypothetical protein
LPACRIGRAVRIDQADLERLRAIPGAPVVTGRPPATRRPTREFSEMAKAVSVPRHGRYT